MTQPSIAAGSSALHLFERIRDVPVTSLHQWLGAILVGRDRTRFCVWAPLRDRIEVELTESGRRFPMQNVDGYHIAEVEQTPPGTLYQYRIDGGPGRPDPASRFQPQGVHGPSQVCSREFPWNDHQWQGIAQEDLVLYELHIGTFTDKGTFDAAIDRLDELVDLGITALELMPVADSAGRWNWGYDGVGWFAPRRTFGTPNDFRRLVDAAHAKGLAVILDVVYNHLGPEGNYLGDFGAYLSDTHTTPWGPAPNFDHPTVGRGVQNFVIANAIHWYDEYHLDGLRIDAIHCMRDDSDPHVVQRLGESVHEWSRRAGRPAMLIAESNVYDPEMLACTKNGGMGFDAQWCDDFLHSVFATVRPGEQLTDRTYHPGSDLAQTLRSGFVYSGTCRQPRQRSTGSERIDTSGLVYSIQNHDFIGNHPLGKRFHQIASADAQQAAAALLILSPAIPMLFMGEEFACEQSFLFFVDFEDEHLRRAVVEGRRAEYPQHDWTGGTCPTDPAAHVASRIGPLHNGDPGMRRWYQELIRIRREWRVAGLLGDRQLTVRSDSDAGYFMMRYDAEVVSARQPTTGLVAVRLQPEDLGEPLAIELPANAELLLDSRPGSTSVGEIGANQAKVFVHPRIVD